MNNLLVIDGHPDRAPERFCHEASATYADGAREAGAEVRVLRLCDMDFPLLGSMTEFAEEPLATDIVEVRGAIHWADHIVFVFPLWLGSAPAKLRGLLEQVARGGFVAEIGTKGWKPRLRGKSARLIVTMGMPALAYRLLFGAHGVQSIRKSILQFAGLSPVHISLLGAIETGGLNEGARRLARIRALGRRLV